MKLENVGKNAEKCGILVREKRSRKTVIKDNDNNSNMCHTQQRENTTEPPGPSLNQPLVVVFPGIV